MQSFYTYIAFSHDNTVLDIGVTIDLERRFRLLNQIHGKSGSTGCKLVYFEEFIESLEATNRENELRELPKKVIKQLVEDTNPMFVNLLKV
ncbi:MAG: GIY-YIG nuclease family protein [Bacteroidales bacterium]|nr:GIY-YIG nuclease family protein [Bacteroidales bacterium]